MKNATATQAVTGSVIGDLMEEPRKKRPAGGRNPGEPKSKQFSRAKKYASPNDLAIAAPVNRAERQMRYWEDFRRARNGDQQASAWVIAMVCDYALPKNAGRLAEAMQPYRDPKTGKIEVGHETLAAEIGVKDAKTIRKLIHAMRDAGYLEYVPGRKGAGFSEFVMTVPDAHRIEDVVSREKIPACDSEPEPPKGGQLKRSAGKKPRLSGASAGKKFPALYIIFSSLMMS